MKCPACEGKLSATKAGSVTLDVCSSSCGGIWFDANELDTVDEQSEPVAFNILRALSNQKVAVDRAKIRSCPKCEGHKLTRVQDAMRSGVDLDSCPYCHGVWLDFGELERLREFNGERAEQLATVERFRKQYESSDPSTRKRMDAVMKLIF